MKQNSFFRVIFRNRHPVSTGASFLEAPEAKEKRKSHVFWTTFFTSSSAVFYGHFLSQIMIFHNTSFYRHKIEFFAGIASCDINLWISKNVPWQRVGNMMAPLGGLNHKKHETVSIFKGLGSSKPSKTWNCRNFQGLGFQNSKTVVIFNVETIKNPNCRQI